MDIPVNIVVTPHAVDILVGEQVIHVHILEAIVALHVTIHLKQVQHHPAGIVVADVVLYPLLVIEKLFEEFLGLYPLLQALLFSFSQLVAQRLDDAVAVVHVVHCRLAGIGGDVQSRIERGKHVNLVLHRQDAADNNSRTCHDRCSVAEHLREVLVHASGDALVLVSAQVAQFAQSSFAGLMYLAQDVKHLFAAWREFAVVLAFLQHLQGEGVFPVLD